MVTRSPALRQVRANSGITFRPDANTALWLPGQDDPQSSTIRDRSGNKNDGTLVGTAWVQNSKGFYVQSFDGADDTTNITAAASINNIWDGGATAICWLNILSAGEAGTGRVLNKRAAVGWTIFNRNLVGNALDLVFFINFDGDDGQWITTANEITVGIDTFLAITYNSSAVGNNPTFYINGGVHTVGDGLTEEVAPTGTRGDDSGETFNIGNHATTINTFDGTIGHVILESRIMSGSEIDNIRRNAQRLFAE